MKERRILSLALFAVDVNHVDNMIPVQLEALRKGHRASSFLGGFFNSVEDVDLLFEIVKKADVLITGLSSFQHDVELELGSRFVKAGGCWFILPDMAGNGFRPKARGRVSDAIAIVPTSAEIKMAKEFGYRKVIYCDGLPKWRVDRQVQPVEIDKQGADILVFVPGIKGAVISDKIAETAINALNKLELNYGIIYTPHPREFSDEVNVNRRDRILRKAKRIIPRGNLTTSQLARSVDLIITPWTSGILESVALTKQLIIAIDTKESRVRKKESTGREVPIPVEAGAVDSATEQNLEQVISHLLTPQGAAELENKQREVYPEPAPGEPLPQERILDYIEDLVG